MAVDVAPTARAPAPAPVTDLPAHIVRLARAIARDCAAPGEYVIRLTVPDYPGQAVTMQTARIEVIREIRSGEWAGACP